MKKIILLILIPFLLFSTQIFATDSGFKFVNFIDNDKLEKNLLSYELNFNGNFQKDDIFKVDFYLNGSFQKVLCSEILNYDSDLIFEKKTCEVEKLGIGEYQFLAMVLRDGQVLKEITTTHQISNIGKSQISFQDLNGSTLINIHVDSQFDKITLYHDIPKSVIERLTYENRENYIQTDLDYKIISENPLIAWNLESPPRNVSYKLNKELTAQEKQNFKVEIEETKHFIFFKYLIGFLLILLLILIFRPIIKNKKIKK